MRIVIQKNAYKIIYGWKDYDDCLEEIEEDNIETRLKFAEPCLKHEKFSNWFEEGVST